MDVSRPSIDRAGRVVYVGSFSKVMLPMLRLGFLGFPGLAPTSLRAAKQLADWSGKRQLKLRWLDSSAKGCWPGTSGKPRASTRRAGNELSMCSSATSPPGSSWCPPPRASTWRHAVAEIPGRAPSPMLLLHLDPAREHTTVCLSRPFHFNGVAPLQRAARRVIEPRARVRADARRPDAERDRWAGPSDG